MRTPDDKDRRVCRVCKATVKDKRELALHNRLCVGGDTSYSVMLVNFNNYERPGRERCSRHHRYRPSSDRPHRSKSGPPKESQSGSLLHSPRQRGKSRQPSARSASIRPCGRGRRGGLGRAALENSLRRKHGENRALYIGRPRGRPRRTMAFDPDPGMRGSDQSNATREKHSLRVHCVNRARLMGRPRGRPRRTIAFDPDPGRRDSDASSATREKYSSRKHCDNNAPSIGRPQGTPSRRGIDLSPSSPIPETPRTFSRNGRGWHSFRDRSSSPLRRRKSHQPERMVRHTSLSPTTHHFVGISQGKRRARSEVRESRARSPSQDSTIGDGHASQGDDCSPTTSSNSRSVEDMRRSFDKFKPYFDSPETSSLGVSRRRFRGGRRGYFCCEIGCSCRKCHYFTLSRLSGRQSSFLRRCDADCPCSKCHLDDHVVATWSRGSPRGAPGERAGSLGGSLAGRGACSPPTAAQGGPSRSQGRTEDEARGGGAPPPSPAGRHRVAIPKRKLTEKVAFAKEVSVQEAERQSLSPKRRRERKEVHYVCNPCGLELNSWYLIRKHLLSSEHLQAVSRDRRKPVSILKKFRPCLCEPPSPENIRSTGATWNADAASTQEHLLTRLNWMRLNGIIIDDVGPGECDVQVSQEPLEASQPLSKNHCSVPERLLAVPEVAGSIEGASGNVSAWKKPMLPSSASKPYGYSSSIEAFLRCTKAGIPGEMAAVGEAPRRLVIRGCARAPVNASPDDQQTTFVRFDYKKKSPPIWRSCHIVRPYMHREGSLVGGQVECAIIKDGAYSCATVSRGSGLQPFVNLGIRCDSEEFEATFEVSGKVQVFPTVSCLAEDRPSTSRDACCGSQGSPQNGYAVGQSIRKANSMIRIDYREKSSSFSSEAARAIGLTYVNVGEMDEVKSPYSKSAIRSLADDEALVERLHLSDSEEVMDDLSNEVVVYKENDDQVVELNSRRFLHLLLGKLNEGGLTCNKCNNKIDGNCIIKQLYGPGGKGLDSDPNSN